MHHSTTPVPRCDQRGGQVCAQCGGHIHKHVTFHQAGCPLLQREPELVGYESCGCPVFYVGTDDGEPVLIIEHRQCLAAVCR